MTEKQEIAIKARGLVALREQQVAAAQAAWEKAFLAAAPEGVFTTDPEVEWANAKNEQEALQHLEVARLGGEIYAARAALADAKKASREATISAMQEAALLGRDAWRKRCL